MDVRLRRLLPLLVVVAALAAPASAAASSSDASSGSDLKTVTDLAKPPHGYKLNARRVKRIAARDPKVISARKDHPHLTADAFTKGPGTWQVSYFDGDNEVVQVTIGDRTHAVSESWSGAQVAWVMARGYPGAFGRKVNAPYVWLPLCAIFLLGLIEWRRPLRIVHLDLLVLLGFGVSHFFFNRGEVGVSVPLVYPVLAYLLCRALWIGFRGRGRGLRPTFPVAWLAIATLFLAGFRIGLDVADSNVIDVGYSGVIGADRITHGRAIYGTFPSDDAFGDTYGPVNYYAYVPFEQVWPWHGTWDDLPAAHGAAVAFDLAAMGALFLLGCTLRPGRRGRELGVILTFAWAAFPYTAFVLESNANDALLAALVVGAFALLRRPAFRGAALALAAATKFAPLVLAPLLATYRDPNPTSAEAPKRARPLWRTILTFALAFAAVAALVMTQTTIDPGLETFYNRTIGFQAGRGSPFSVWGQVDGIDWLRTALLVATGALSLLVAFRPRNKTPVQALALGAAVLIALQLTLHHWFYLYIVWFFPLLIAALAALDDDLGRSHGSREFAAFKGN